MCLLQGPPGPPGLQGPVGAPGIAVSSSFRANPNLADTEFFELLAPHSGTYFKAPLTVLSLSTYMQFFTVNKPAWVLLYGRFTAGQ